ncbi:MAG: TolC family outer membrane protein [Pseudomonadota bacterium]
MAGNSFKPALKAMLFCGASAILMAPASSFALGLEEAVQVALETNPEVGEAVANKEARDFELDRARGNYYPQVTLEGRSGPGYRDTRANDGNQEWRLRSEASVTVQQMLFDGFATDSEVEASASRIDSAALRVMERSEFIGLEVVRTYIDILRQRELVDLANQNLDTLQRIYRDVVDRVDSGASSVADQQQADERIQNARSLLVDFERSLEEAEITFERLVGEPPQNLADMQSGPQGMPASREQAVQMALENNPSIQFARADLDAAYADWEASKSAFYPEVSLVGTARAGYNLDDTEGKNHDLSLQLVVSYPLFTGGIDTANREIAVREISQAREAVLNQEREAEELVRQSWSSVMANERRIEVLQDQVVSSEQVRNSYLDQFGIGQRTLLDLLDSENELFNARVSLATSEYAEIFARYRVLAAAGQLLDTLGVQPPKQAQAMARQEATVPETPEEETMSRQEPRWLQSD